jgi:hypothetical protein
MFHPSLLRKHQQLFRVCCFRRQRPLTVHIFAGSYRCSDDGSVLRRGRKDDNQIHISMFYELSEVPECVWDAKRIRESRSLIDAAAGDSYDVIIGQKSKGRDMSIPTPVADADQSDSYFRLLCHLFLSRDCS